MISIDKKQIFTFQIRYPSSISEKFVLFLVSSFNQNNLEWFLNINKIFCSFPISARDHSYKNLLLKFYWIDGVFSQKRSETIFVCNQTHTGRKPYIRVNYQLIYGHSQPSFETIKLILLIQKRLKLNLDIIYLTLSSNVFMIHFPSLVLKAKEAFCSEMKVI